MDKKKYIYISLFILYSVLGYIGDSAFANDSMTESPKTIQANQAKIEDAPCNKFAGVVEGPFGH